MPKRLIETERWKDPWFRRLKPYEKLLFMYLCENCDIAGFLEIDLELIRFYTNMPERDIEGALKGLSRGIDGADGWIWVKNFAKHQGNLPLNPKNGAHKGILYRLNEQLTRFPHAPEYLGASKGLLSSISKSTSTSKSNSPEDQKGININTAQDLIKHKKQNADLPF